MKSARQLTLFDCSRPNADDKSTEERSESSPVRTDCTSKESEGAQGVSVQYGEGCQISCSNNITILSPAGPTTVTINPEISENELQVPERSVSQLSNLPPQDIANGPCTPVTPPVQPRNIRFPSTNLSGKLRSFNPTWYSAYPWLEYSVSRDAAFCYPCRLFTTGTGKAEKAFTVNGFHD